MNNILIIYNGWKIRKTEKGFFAIFISSTGREFRISEYKKKLEDIFFHCDMIDLQIAREKIERGCEM